MQLTAANRSYCAVSKKVEDERQEKGELHHKSLRAFWAEKAMQVDGANPPRPRTPRKGDSEAVPAEAHNGGKLPSFN